MQMPDKSPILLVDDRPENLTAIEVLLSDMPCELVRASSGNEALRKILKHDFALVLLDVQMPDMDGFETAELMRANPKTRHLPIIFVTAGMSDRTHLFKGYESGAVDYLIKPIEPQFLRSKVKVFCDLHLQRRKIEFQNRQLSRMNQELASTLDSLSLAHTELTRSEKLAALGSVVAGIAHELNTPIGNSLLVASTLLDQTRSLAKNIGGGIKRSMLENYISETDKASDILVRNLHRAASLIASFKQVAVDQTSSRRRSFLLAEVVAEIMLTLWPALKTTSFTVEQNIPDGILMDSFPGPLGQVVINLVNNALLHGFDGRKAGIVEISAARSGDGRVQLIIKDDGVGIPDNEIDHVFDPFFTTKAGRGGSGLGLNIVRSIVKDVLGGEVLLTSKVGIGTTFTLVLPRVAPQAQQEGYP